MIFTFLEVVAILLGEPARAEDAAVLGLKLAAGYGDDIVRAREAVLRQYPELHRRMAMFEGLDKVYTGCLVVQLQESLERYRAASGLPREFVV
jgi:hypothetical protein